MQINTHSFAGNIITFSRSRDIATFSQSFLIFTRSRCIIIIITTKPAYGSAMTSSKSSTTTKSSPSAAAARAASGASCDNVCSRFNNTNDSHTTQRKQPSCNLLNDGQQRHGQHAAAVWPRSVARDESEKDVGERARLVR